MRKIKIGDEVYVYDTFCIKPLFTGIVVYIDIYDRWMAVKTSTGEHVECSFYNVRFKSRKINKLLYREEIKDLFTTTNDYYFAHCISADFAMGKGIAIEFNKRFNMKNKLKSKYPDFLEYYKNNSLSGTCILEDRVFNLITKERYFHKPTYESMQESLNIMKSLCIKNNIKKVAMPTIGCGLDRLNWDTVSSMLIDIFKDTNIEILVCKVK